MADDLQVNADRYAAGTLTKTAFKRLETQYGLVYEKEGLVWDLYLRQYFSTVDSTYKDGMHIICSSGGV
eukprot:10525206-Karenia_brevis.AAC.1